MVDLETVVLIALGPAYVMAYALAGKVAMSVMESATQTALTATIPAGTKLQVS
jgi:hypothetical protein